MLDSPPALRGNSTTKADQLSRAKEAIEAGEQSLHVAAEALDVAQQEFEATQREIAEAVGKSVAWVNRLLQWRKGGCAGTPFGPGSKSGRERRKLVQSTEQRPQKFDASAERGKDECAKREAEHNPRARKELAEFKHAVDIRFPHMDEDTRREAIEYVIAKGKVKA